MRSRGGVFLWREECRIWEYISGVIHVGINGVSRVLEHYNNAAQNQTYLTA